jgi:hypothetical protein
MNYVCKDSKKTQDSRRIGKKIFWIVGVTEEPAVKLPAIFMNSRGDRYLSHRSRHTQVPVPATKGEEKVLFKRLCDRSMSGQDNSQELLA